MIAKIAAFFVGLVVWCPSLAGGAIVATILEEPLLLTAAIHLQEPPYVLDVEEAFDLNGDGSDDFSLSNNFLFFSDVRTHRANRVIATVPPPPNLGGGGLALDEGFEIGSILGENVQWLNGDLTDHYVDDGQTQNAHVNLIMCFDRCNQNFNGRGYLGVEFEIDGEMHYGWMDLFVAGGGVTVYGWAYESEPGVSIRAGAIPEPSGVMLVGLGFVGIALRRNRRERK